MGVFGLSGLDDLPLPGLSTFWRAAIAMENGTLGSFCKILFMIAILYLYMF
jgi:hypothetical protein